MKSFLIILSLIFLVAIGTLWVNDRIVMNLIFSSSNANIYRMHRLFNENHDEVAIIGSSRAEANFSPSEIGVGIFNYGVSGSEQRETLIHLKALLSRKNKKPIIINLDPWGIRCGESILGDYRLVESDLLVEADKIKPVKWHDRIPGLRFYGKLRVALADWVNATHGGTKTIDHGAILQRISRTDGEWSYIIKRCNPFKFTLDKDVMAEYANVLSRDHPTVVFVISPISSPWYSRWDGQQELARLKESLARFPNTVVIDCCTSKIGDYGFSEFMDLIHLNEKGARRFSKELRQKLLKQGLLKGD